MSESPHIHIHTVTADNFDARVIQRSLEVPVLVDFWADWCAPCKMLMPILASLAEEYAGKFELAKVNSDEQGELAGRYGVRSLPTVKLFRHGKPVDEFMGALPESAVREFLEHHMERASDAIRQAALRARTEGDLEQAIALLQTALGNDPDHYQIHQDLAETLLSNAQPIEAGKVLDALPARVRAEPEFVALGNRLSFAEIAAGIQDPLALEQAIQSNPSDCGSRYQLSAMYIQAGAYQHALEQLLEIMKLDRTFRDDAGRKGMLAVFEMLGGSGELVSRYRALMSSALY